MRKRRIPTAWKFLILLTILGAMTFGPGLFPAVLAQEDATGTAESVDHDVIEMGAEILHIEEDSAHGEDHGDGHGGGHDDPVTPVLLEILVILLLAKIGGDIAERLKQPAVLGELLVGVLLGALTLIVPEEGSAVRTFVEQIRAEGSHIDILARIGVIILLFEVGLESNLKQLKSVGTSSFLVATVGVVAPFALGYFVSQWLITDFSALHPRIEPYHVHMFIGATLCATSVGITARVLKDLGRIQQRESQIVLGAAVIDDIMGLVILAVVSGIITQAETGGAGGEETSLALIIAKISGLALIFLVGAVLLGIYVMPRFFNFWSSLRGHGLLLTGSLAFCFLLAFIAGKIQLAGIVGAFAAGLVLEDVHFKPFHDKKKEHGSLEDLVRPISAFLVPIFFVQMGAKVQLETFMNFGVLSLALFLTIAAFIGKQVCGLVVVEKGSNRLAVGLGMVPRGEVGLIFAGIGMSLGVVDAGTFSAIVIMVMVTTMVTPPLLTWALNRKGEPQP